MATQQFSVDGVLYTVLTDLFFEYGVVASGAVRNATTGALLQTVPAVSVDLAGVTARFTQGYFAAAANVSQVFPKLATQTYAFTITFQAAGYRPAVVPVAVPMNAVFPLAPGDAQLMPLPARLQGRVVRNTVLRPPVAGALIASSDPARPLLRTGVSAKHTAGETVQQVTLTPTGPVRHVSIACTQGESILHLDNLVGLVPGAVLKLGTDDRDDYVRVLAVGAVVVLQLPLVRSFAAGSNVQEQTPGAPLVSTTLAAPVEIDDGALSLTSNLANGVDPVAIGSGVDLEYRTLGALTDADGYYRLNGLTGFASLPITATKIPFPVQTVNWMPVYGLDPNILNFRL